jgi:hypothetical protein
MKRLMIGMVLALGTLTAAQPSPLSPQVVQGKNLYLPLPKPVDLSHEKAIQLNDQNGTTHAGGRG